MFAAIVAVIAAALRPPTGMVGYLRWGIVMLLMLLHVVMNNPVWHLLTRIDLVGGSTGWYRYKLIDDFIKNFGQWWMLGTISTFGWREWAATTSPTSMSWKGRPAD